MSKCENCGTEDAGAPSYKPACLVERDALRAQIESLKQELLVTQGFYKVAIAERNLAWKQVESLTIERSALVEALSLAMGCADSWIHDQLDGTSLLEDALEELNAPRTLLERYKL